MKKVLILCFAYISFNLSAQITNGLLVHYKLNGDANDVTSNQINGTVNGAFGSLDRNNNQNGSLGFDGIDDNVELTNSLVLKPQFPLSIAYWVKVDQLEAGVFYCSDFIDNKYFGFWTGITSDGEVHINFGDGGVSGLESRISKVSSQKIQVGVWHHIVCTIRDAYNMEIFIDCQDAGGFYSGSGNTSMVYGDYAARMFNLQSNGGGMPAFLKGNLDELMIWNRVISNSEVQDFCLTNLVSNIDRLENIKLYPNPTTNLLNIDFTNKEINNLSLYNSEGKLVMTNNKDFQTIDLTNFENGIYFLNIQDKSLLTRTFKVIKL